MLDFLEDQNPLIRNSSKNWLLESMISFQRVIDPILEILLLSKMGQWDQKNK
jgi:hypothetical protein